MAATDTPPRVLSLSEAAEVLHMKRPNVAKFLARRGVSPAIEKASGYFWWEADILRVKAEREADERRMGSDRRRRASALARAAGGEAGREMPPPEIPRLGRTQRDLLTSMLRRPVVPTVDGPERFALRRLAQRGLATPIEGERGFTLTDEGRRVAAEVDR